MCLGLVCFLAFISALVHVSVWVFKVIVNHVLMPGLEVPRTDITSKTEVDQ